MALFVEMTMSAIADVARSIPEPIEILIFGSVIASIGFLLRVLPAKHARAKEERELAGKA